MGSERTGFSFVSDPSDQTYQNLLTALAERAAFVGFVVREEMPRDANVDHVLGAVSAFVVEDGESSEWPGTKLLSATARVLRARPSSQVILVLEQAASSLFSWKHPALPEDLFFEREDGSVLLGTIAHEGDGFLSLDDEEYAFMCSRVPGFGSLVRLG